MLVFYGTSSFYDMVKLKEKKTGGGEAIDQKLQITLMVSREAWGLTKICTSVRFPASTQQMVPWNLTSPIKDTRLSNSKLTVNITFYLLL